MNRTPPPERAGAVHGAGLAGGLGLSALGFIFGQPVLLLLGVATLAITGVVRLAGASFGGLGVRLRRRLHWTTEGKVYCTATLLFGAAAINTGANLLFLIVGLLLALIVISGVLSETTLLGLSVRLIVPERIHRGQPVEAWVVYRNAKRFLPTHSVAIGLADDAPCRIVGPPPYVLALAPGETARVPVRLVFSGRGVARLPLVSLLTRFPFSLFEKVAFRRIDWEGVVFPAVRPLAPGLVRPEGRERRGHALVREGEEFRSVRDYRPGDSPRKIHWRSSARRGRLVVKELETRSAEARTVALHPAPGAAPQAFEEACDLAASLVAAIRKQGGRAVLLASLAGEVVARADAGGPEGDLPLLRALALATPETASAGALLSRLAHREALLVTALGPSQVPAGLPAGVRPLAVGDPEAAARLYAEATPP